MATSTSKKADIGVIGLAVMGQNLILNINDNGFKVVAFNRTVSKVQEFVAKHPDILPASSIREFVDRLSLPRKALLMVKAGQAVDEFVEQLLELLEPGDIIIDGGNSHYLDTERRCKRTMEKGVHFVGCGISGGEEGARYGPSIMPGGSVEAWHAIAPILTAIAAKVAVHDRKSEPIHRMDFKVPCCAWLGERGAGHFVKMVHNGIEYGDMQLIAEAYHLLSSFTDLNSSQIAKVFHKWNNEELNSFLIEITARIFEVKDSKGQAIVQNIRDCAGQKGTGKWTINSALELGFPTTLIAEAVFARGLSSLKQERQNVSTFYPKQQVALVDDESKFLEDLKKVNDWKLIFRHCMHQKLFHMHRALCF